MEIHNFDLNYLQYFGLNEYIDFQVQNYIFGHRLRVYHHQLQHFLLVVNHNIEHYLNKDNNHNKILI